MRLLSMPRMFGPGRSFLDEGLVAALLLCGVAASVWAAPGIAGGLGAALALIMLAIAVIDARLFIIPDELTVAGFALALVNAAVTAPDGMVEAVGMAVLRGAVLALLFFGLRAGYRRLRGREGMGGGDPRLFAAIGAWVGAWQLPAILLGAGLFGLAAVAAMRLRGEAVTATSRLPLGTLMTLAAWPVWLVVAFT